MSKSFFLLVAFFLVLLIAVLHIIALKFYFYWAIGWFDLFMHFLGGLWVSFVILWMCFFTGDSKVPRRFSTFFITALVSSVSVGLLWEIFELGARATYTAGNYEIDTLTDIGMDILGGLVSSVYLFGKSKKFRLQKNI